MLSQKHSRRVPKHLQNRTRERLIVSTCPIGRASETRCKSHQSESATIRTRTTTFHASEERLVSPTRVDPTKRNRSWACAPLIVPKLGSEKLRFSVDLRPLNQQNMPHAWPMLNLEASLAGLSSSTCYAQLDFCQGFWQLPLAQESHTPCSFIKPDGSFSPTRVLQRLTNSAIHLSRSLNEPKNESLYYLEQQQSTLPSEKHLESQVVAKCKSHQHVNKKKSQRNHLRRSRKGNKIGGEATVP